MELGILVDPGTPATHEGVDERRPFAGRDEAFDEVAAEEARSTGDEDASHGR
jgi:hypothetical protein